ncbi:branched-chain amino acid transport system substrate-binding protein [Natronorubrum sediminis]|uniref:Branched-chain amino acid transport system substrate-binding protein n=2 Tax=Natronorubrum sediminis TaxID=640943 RepID=A0A1H6FM07_9EURY|nr:branched-chain amino acid transport system substrate-binding protein [Natronorubrum sediminis]
MNRRRFLAATGAGAVMTTVAGCAGRGGDDDVFRIGHIGPTTQPMGIGSEQSAEIAVDQIDEILDQEVELLTGDTEAEVDHAEAVIETMIVEDNIDLLVGTFVTEVTQGIMDFVAERDVPFIITGSADTETVVDYHGEDYETYKNIFRTGPINSSLQAESVVEYAEFLADEHGWTSFGLLRDDAAWTVPFGDEIPGLFEETDLSLDYETAADIETDDFTSYYDSFESEGVDVVLRIAAHANGANLVSTWQGEYNFAMEGIHVTSMSPEFWDQTNGACLYESTGQAGAGGVTEMSDGDETMSFVEAYQEEYGDEEPSMPMYMGFNTYDAINFYKEAVEDAGTADYDDDLDDIVDAMLSLTYDGTAGEISLYGEDDEYPHDVQEVRDEDDRIVNFPITQWQEGGEVECVFPETYATADHQAPDWM